MDLPAPPFRALVSEAVRLLGSQPALAKAIGRSQQQVSALCTRAFTISAEDALAIHRATNGEVAASDLRPDLWCRPEDVPALAAGPNEPSPATAGAGA